MEGLCADSTATKTTTSTSGTTNRDAKPPQPRPPQAGPTLAVIEPAGVQFQSTSAPTSPTKIPLSMISIAVSGDNNSNSSNQSTNAAYTNSGSGNGSDSSAESTASAGAVHSRAMCTFGVDIGAAAGRLKSHRSVKFPEDNAIVTGYHEAPDPFRYVVEMDNDVESVEIAYREACVKQSIAPIPAVLKQIQNFKCNRMRAQDLILRGEQLDAGQCEALEEVLKRVLFRLVDLDSCNLDCDGASALFDMIEFYESASHLSIANNTSIGVIGWQSLCRTLKKTSCLQYLDLRNTGLNEQILLIMGRTIRVGSHLVTLHLENAGLFSRRLAILVSSIKFNTSLRELYLGENKICSADCVQLANLLRGNAFLNVLDLRCNLIQDIGLDHICEGLSHQPSTCSVFDIFQTKNNRRVMSQNSGILVLNLSDNQLTSRAINRLAQTLSQCRSLIGLDLSNNSLGDDGALILQEGLLQCKTLKYLNLSNTGMTSEGSNAIAEVINCANSNLSIIDLSNNDIAQDGIGVIRDAIRCNKRITKLVLLPQSSYPPSDGTLPNPLYEEMVEEIDSCCDRNKAEAKFDEVDEILSMHLRSDISIYGGFEVNLGNPFNDNNNNINFTNEAMPPGGVAARLHTSSFYCDNGTGISTDADEDAVDVDADADADVDTSGESSAVAANKKPMLMRTASLGSWERPVKSGRFSVSPVDLNISVDDYDDAADQSASPLIQISVDMISPDDEANDNANDDDDNNNDNNNNNNNAIAAAGNAERITASIGGNAVEITVATSCGSGSDYYGSDDDNGSDISQTETDQFSELPSRDTMLGAMSRLMPPQRSFRRMSSPAITVAGIVKTAKPKANLQLKLSGNLESLDLKSSLPLSPTLFAKFDFSDLSLLRLPAEVEEIIANLPIRYDDSGELIFQFEQDFICLNDVDDDDNGSSSGRNHKNNNKNNPFNASPQSQNINEQCLY